jgi:hypothetical protein
LLNYSQYDRLFAIMASAEAAMVYCVGNGHGQATGRLCEDRALGIIGACREAGAPEPRLQFDARDVWVEFPFPSEYLAIVPAASEARVGVTRPE